MWTQPRPVVIDGRPYAAADVIDALTPYLYPGRVDRMTGVLDYRLGGLAMGVEDLHKSHNGAACIRTAEGLGVQDIAAIEVRNTYPLELPEGDGPGEDEGREPNERAVERISRWAHRWVDLHRLPSTKAALAWAKARQMRVFGAGPRGGLTLESLPVDQPLLVLFGNEADGLQPETLDACTDTFRIPMHGFTESFNVSVSVGMVLSRLGQRYRDRLATEGRTSDLPQNRRDFLLAQWMSQDVKAAGPIMRRARPDA